MALRIVSDSSIDIYSLPGVDFVTVPLRIRCGTEEFTDNAELDVAHMCDFFEHNREKSSTSCPNIMDWRDAFEGADTILALTISSALSGSYSSCRQAMEEYLEEHPAAHGYVLDSLSTGPMLRMLADRAIELWSDDMEFPEFVKEMELYRRHCTLVFTLSSMNNMARNGRLSPAVAKAASILGIRVIAVGDEEGRVKMMAKCRGAARLPGIVVDEIQRLGFHGGRIYIDHCFCRDLVDRILKILLERFPGSQVNLWTTGGLCSYYAERGGVIIAFEDALARV